MDIERAIKRGAELLSGKVPASELAGLEEEEVAELLRKAPESREVQAAFKSIGIPLSSHKSRTPFAVIQSERGQLSLAYGPSKMTYAELRAKMEHERQHVNDLKGGVNVERYYIGEVRGVLREVKTLLLMTKRGKIAEKDANSALKRVVDVGLDPKTFSDILYKTYVLAVIGTKGYVPDPEEISEEDLREIFREVVTLFARKVAERRDTKELLELTRAIVEPNVLAPGDEDFLENIMRMAEKIGCDECRESLEAYGRVLRTLRGL